MINEYNATLTICHKIAELRRNAGLTQEALADKLGITYQAISKWENCLSCPDITLLPRLADIFEISIDALFGRKEETKIVDLPWGDDGKLRVVLFNGTRLADKKEYRKEKEKLTFELHGNAKDIISDISVHCGAVEGTINTGSVQCMGVSGTINTGSIQCQGVEGTINAGSVRCEEVNGNLTVGSAKCGTVNGDIIIEAGSISVESELIGDILVKDSKDAVTITGDILGDIQIKNGECVRIDGNVDGDIHVNGTVGTLAIEGDFDGECK